jgi:hypothetical protein
MSALTDGGVVVSGLKLFVHGRDRYGNFAIQAAFSDTTLIS